MIDEPRTDGGDAGERVRWSLSRRGLLVLLVVGALAMAGIPVPPSGFGGGTPAGLIGAAAAADPTGSFAENPFTVTRGKKVDIEFSHSGPAILYVDNETLGYHLEVSVDGDGTDTVTVDTYASSSAVASDYVDGGTPRLVSPGNGLDRSLPAGRYTLSLSVGRRTVDLGSLVVEARPPIDLRTMTAPRDVAIDDVEQNALIGRSTERATVAKGDYGVFVFDTPGLGQVIDPEDLRGGAGANGAEVFFEDVDAESADTNESFNATANQAITPMWDEEAAQLVLVWDTGNLSLHGENRTFDVRLILHGRYNELRTEDTVAAESTITVDTPKITLDTRDELVVYPWEGRRLELKGTSNYAPGHTFQFQAPTTHPTPILRRATATVNGNGRYSTTIDVGGFAPGYSSPLTVHEYLYKAEWRLDVKRPTADLRFPDQTATDARVTLENVSTSVGGFVVLTNGKGSVIGVTAPLGDGPDGSVPVDIRPGRSGQIEVTATPYMDWNQNDAFEKKADRPYKRKGSAIARTAVVTVPKDVVPSSTPTPATSQGATTAGGTGETTYTVVTRSAITPVSTTGNAPLPIAVPLLALAVTALLVRSRLRT